MKRKDIKGYEGLYSVTTDGNVISRYKEYTMPRNGGIRKSNERILRPGNEGKYLFVVLQKNGYKKHYKVHRLVAEAFVDNPYNKPIVNHINGIKTDNRAENLEWVTHKENSKHAVDTGLRLYQNVSSEKSNLAKITNLEALEIRRYYDNGGSKTTRQLAKEYGVEKSTIVRIKNRKTFKNVK